MIIVKYGDVNCASSYGWYSKLCEPRFEGDSYVLCAVCNWREVLDLETCRGETQIGGRCKKQPNFESRFCNIHSYEDERSRAKRWYSISRSIFAAEMDYAIEQLQHYVYIIMADGFVKIGHSVNPELRLKSLKSQSDATLRPNKVNQENMKLLKVVKGGYGLEQMLQHMCVRSRVIGEWYKHDSFVAEIIERLDNSWIEKVK